jgi:cobalt-zinc-cadmium efflux system outer membrane protein
VRILRGGTKQVQRRWFIAIVVALVSGCARFEPKPIDPARTAMELDGRRLDTPELRAFLEKNEVATADWPPQQWDFEKLTLAALFLNPELEVARAQWAVARAGLITAAARPNPTVGMTPEYTVNAASGVSPWIATVNFDVPVETAGKHHHRIARAEYGAVAARANVYSLAWQVRSRLRAALIDFTTAAERVKLLQAQRTVEEEVYRRLEQKLRAGAIETLEVSRARLAVSRLKLEAEDAERRQGEAFTRVAEAIGVPVKALEGARIAEDWAVADGVEMEARTRALHSRSDVLSALAEYEASQSRLRLEIAKQFPDLHLGPGYQYDQGENKWALGLSLELPVLNRNEGPIAEAEATRSEAAARFTAVQAKVIGEIDQALAVFRNAEERVKSLQSLRIEQQRLAEMMEARVKVGVAEPLDLLAVQSELAASAVIESDARVQLVRAFGQVEDAMQSPFRIPDGIEGKLKNDGGPDEEADEKGRTEDYEYD